jgi:O-acetyl-ADP-ribose deacetylase (regulator of RNase III)
MGPVRAKKVWSEEQVLRLVHGDITDSHVDAIVNAANSRLAHGGGVAGAIIRRGGRQIQQESDAWIKAHGPVTYEEPAVTGAGQLPSEYVIHAVGPRWGEGDEERKLAAAVTGSLSAAAGMGLGSLALPAISTGIFGFPVARAATVIVGAIADFVEQNPSTSLRDIRLVLIDEAGVESFAGEFARRWPESVPGK